MSEFYKLSKEEQDKEVARVLRELAIYAEELDRTGQWNENADQELKEKAKKGGGRVTLWTRTGHDV